MEIDYLQLLLKEESNLEQIDVCIKKMENRQELECLINNEQLILCDNMQNTFIIINLDGKSSVGIGYYDYGIAPDFKCSEDSGLIYVGVGKNLLCINTYENNVLFNESLQSVFYELLYDLNNNYICVICELDLYCYHLKEQKWKIGFRSIINDYSITNDNIYILCDDGIEYLFSLEDGKLVV